VLFLLFFGLSLGICAIKLLHGFIIQVTDVRKKGTQSVSSSVSGGGQDKRTARPDHNIKQCKTRTQGKTRQDWERAGGGGGSK
jgi:hypothetical protein